MKSTIPLPLVLAGTIVLVSLTPGRVAAAGEASHFRVQQDFRYCEYPACGGFFLRALNQETMRCADGTDAASCYVVEIDWSGMEPRPGTAEIGRYEKAAFSGTLIVEGQLETFHPLIGEERASAVTLGVLRARQAWLPATSTPPDAGERIP